MTKMGRPPGSGHRVLVDYETYADATAFYTARGVDLTERICALLYDDMERIEREEKERATRPAYAKPPYWREPWFDGQPRK